MPNGNTHFITKVKSPKEVASMARDSSTRVRMTEAISTSVLRIGDDSVGIIGQVRLSLYGQRVVYFVVKVITDLVKINGLEKLQVDWFRGSFRLSVGSD